MNIILINPISILIESAKLIVEDDDTGTIEFSVLGQPVRLSINSGDYVYDSQINLEDRVKLTEAFSILKEDSKGVVKKIILDVTEDRVQVLFDEIYPDQIAKNIEAHIVSTVLSLLIEIPLRIVEKI